MGSVLLLLLLLPVCLALLSQLKGIVKSWINMLKACSATGYMRASGGSHGSNAHIFDNFLAAETSHDYSQPASRYTMAS